jgi:hypothetical protein
MNEMEKNSQYTFSNFKDVSESRIKMLSGLQNKGKKKEEKENRNLDSRKVKLS